MVDIHIRNPDEGSLLQASLKTPFPFDPFDKIPRGLEDW